jgi:hypothetical protein
MNTGIMSTRALLRAWGRWGAINIGYPSACPTFRLTGRSPLHPVGHIPPDVLDIENAIGRVEWQERQLVIHRYQWHMTLREIGTRIGCSLWAARRKVEDAEYAVHVAYCNLGKNVVITGILSNCP